MNSSTSNQLFDLSNINQVFRGNQDMINNVIQLFLENVPEYIGEMEKCVERQDFISLYPLAHKAKSSISMIGAKNMEQLVSTIEEDSRNHRNQGGLGSLVQELRAKCNLVNEQLRCFLDTNQTV